ncbi:pyridoxamine 5'-phosphate oxidase family protein [Luteimonas sp. SDU101]|uniref:pyridoxamine 5'-phosphate oxidase family protein n=1 Tax=Luteimonas sp. SDU101 TaxID=3422593 RepID=UPI003EBFE4CC
MTTDSATDPALLHDEVAQIAARSVLCWLATVDGDGQPSVSPKELFAIVDANHVVIANIASPASARNLRAQPRVCVSFIDVLVQKGWKVFGTAHEVRPADEGFASWAAPLLDRAGTRFPLRSVFVVRATALRRILAPSYLLYPHETTEASQVAAARAAYRLP